jgi:hypothetical protein
MNSTWLALGIAIVFPFMFCGMWIFVSMLISIVGGWKKLAQSYPDSSPKRKYTYTFQSGRMGPANYQGVLKIGADETGLHLAVVVLFRLFHPPLSSPWEDLRQLEFTQIFFTKRARFTCRAHPGIRIQLPEKVMKDLQQSSCLT